MGLFRRLVVAVEELAFCASEQHAAIQRAEQVQLDLIAKWQVFEERQRQYGAALQTHIAQCEAVYCEVLIQHQGTLQ
jgi:hypothetical protein